MHSRRRSRSRDVMLNSRQLNPPPQLANAISVYE